MSLVKHTVLLSVIKNFYKHSFNVCNSNICRLSSHRLYCSVGALVTPSVDGSDKVYPPKIKQIVEEISKLTLIEVADLNECLKKTLNIKDVPMSMGVMASAATPVAEDEEAEPQVTKSSFTVKLIKYEDTKKVAVIKEVKNHIEGMNLVQAKKFVESVPQVIKADIAKDEAEKLKQLLEAAGATCEIS